MICVRLERAGITYDLVWRQVSKNGTIGQQGLSAPAHEFNHSGVSKRAIALMTWVDDSKIGVNGVKLM